MRIAICDDEPQELHLVETLLRRYAPGVSIARFSSADDLLDAAQTEFFPLIYLDIEMTNTNGFDAAEELMQQEQAPLIIFVTKSAEYSVRGYDVAFHYLVKPIQEDKFREVLERALRRLTPHYFSFSADGAAYRIPVQDILYFESHSYMLEIHTLQQVYPTRLRLKDVEDALYGAGFFRIHASFLVNLQHVVRIAKNDITLQNGKVLRVSRNRKKPFDAAFLEFARKNI